MTTWTEDQQTEALAQGWGLFTMEGKLQLQRHDEAEIFEGDEGAWLHVVERREVCDPLAMAAMSCLLAVNPGEYCAIIRYVAINRNIAA